MRTNHNSAAKNLCYVSSAMSLAVLLYSVVNDQFQDQYVLSSSLSLQSLCSTAVFFAAGIIFEARAVDNQRMNSEKVHAFSVVESDSKAR